MLELRSIARGIEATDAMVKAAQVSLLRSAPICSGKYLILVGGLVADVKSAMADGEEVAEYSVVDKLIIPNIHQDIFPALTFTTQIGEIDALGIIEAFSASSTIIGADLSAKAAKVQLIQIRLANGIGGKGYFTLTGDVGAVRAAVSAASEALSAQGMLVEAVVIPQPHHDISPFLI